MPALPHPPGQQRLNHTCYWCEAFATLPTGEHFTLGTHTATTPRLALRWLRARASEIAEQLDTPAAGLLHQWACNHAEHERALDDLTHGRPYSFTAHDEDATPYMLRVTPAPAPAPWRPTP